MMSSTFATLKSFFLKREQPALLPGFFLSGFECSTFKWKDGRRRNLVKESQHDVQADNDYKLVRALGIGASREAIPWPDIDKKGAYDFSCIDPFINAMVKYDIVPVWDLCHYGFPDDIDPFTDEFSNRFANYCGAAATYLLQKMKPPYFFSPINEITYFALIGSKWGWVAPYRKNKNDYERFRLSLCKAAIAGVKAIRKIMPGARMIHMDPLVEVVGPPGDISKQKKAWYEMHVDTYMAWDILAGKKHPELGGSPAILDVVGVNNYAGGFLEYAGEMGPQKTLKETDQRLVSLCSLLEVVWKRYRLPILISETSRTDDTRASWMKDMMEECLAAINRGINIQGVCFYPAIGSPNWNKDEWVQSGFYNVEKKDGILERSLYEPYVAELFRWQKLFGHITMLDDDDKPFTRQERQRIINAARKLNPVPDKDWHR
jgi:beta-glucosidase/6-phospho-beta-glucosidase/beta-galactosidase